MHRDGIRLYANQAGNSLAAPVVLPRFPSSDEATTVALIDVFSSGTACLVWSSPHLRHATEPMRSRRGRRRRSNWGRGQRPEHFRLSLARFRCGGPDQPLIQAREARLVSST